MYQNQTLIQFLEDSGAQLRIFDLGRRICELDRDLFLDFEKTESAYPLPKNKKAWFAIVKFDLQTRKEPIIWFLCFNLDEQGKLIQSCRDYFIKRLIDSVAEGDNLIADIAKDNPFTFRPNNEKLANLHSILSYSLNQEPSHYFQHTYNYFNGELEWNQWKFIGYQGIADIAARNSNPKINRILNSAIPSLPDEPLIALCHCLENHKIKKQTSMVLIEKLDRELSKKIYNKNLLAAILRSLSQSNKKFIKKAILHILNKEDALNIEILVSIGSRSWEALIDKELMELYVSKLAHEDIQRDVFIECISDLIQMPNYRSHVLSAIKSEKQPQQVTERFNYLLKVKAFNH